MNDLPVSDKKLKPLPCAPCFEYIPDDDAENSEEQANALRAILETTFNNREYANPPMKGPPASRGSVMAAPA